VVIDNSSLYRYDPDVPLIVPEVNADAIHGYAKKNIIANPNCSTAQMVVALKPLHDRAKITRVVVSTYQSVSGAGKEGMDELWNQTKAVYNPTDGSAAEEVLQADRLQRDPAYRRLPRLGRDQGRMEDGGRDEEDPRPEDQGHGDLRPGSGLRRPFGSDQHRDRRVPGLAGSPGHPARSPGIMLVDKREPGGYITPIECVGEFATYVSRVRQDSTIENGLNLWCVSDNLRKGAALNAVQIAELLGSKVLKKG
jgi:aspartate-semialdehyde dehydrogenase